MKTLMAVALAMTASTSWAAAPSSTAAADDLVRSVDRPYQRREQAQIPQVVTPAARAAQPQPAPAKPPATFSLLVSDVDVPRAFERWARERNVTLRWLVGRDHAIDAGTPQVVPDPADVQLARNAGSADPELVAAMVKVAKSFGKSKYPFVIREYDNAIVVQPKSGERQ